MNNATRILIVEDQTSDYELAQREIRKEVDLCEFERVENQADYLQALERFQPDLILADFSLPDFDGITALKLAQQHRPTAPVIIWSGVMSEDVAVQCVKEGAANYVLKENIKRLGSAVLRALQERRLSLELEQAQGRFRSLYENSPVGIFQSTPQGRYVSVNPALAQIYGYDSPEEMLRSITNIGSQVYLSPEDRRLFTEALKTDDGVVRGFETKNVRKDGRIIWTSTSARAIHDPAGNIVFYEGFLQDITDRKLAEEKVAESEKRIRALIEHGMDSISVLAKDGTLLWESPSFNRTLGYAKDAFVGRNIFDLIHPDDREWIGEIFAKVVNERGRVEQTVLRLKHKDGSWRWIEARASNMLEEPSVAGVVVNYRDITQRKEAEEELRENREKYRNLVETSHDLIWSVDAQGQITFLNRAAKDIYGYEPEELIGRSFFEIMDPDYLPKDPSAFYEAMLDTDEYENVETHVRHQDGRKSVLSANSIVLRDQNGKVLGVAGSSRNITAQKQAEDQLRESEERYRLLFENNPLPMWIFDTETWEFLQVNEAAIAHYGYSRAEFLSMTIKDIRPAEDVHKLLDAMSEPVERPHRTVREGVWRHRKKDGTVIMVQIISHRMEFEGRQAELILATDVTERYQAEVEIQQKNDDLALVNALNDVINQGQGLDSVVALMRQEIKRIFGGEGVAIYLLNPDGKSLKMQQYQLRSEISDRLEKLLGRPVPAIEIPVQENGYFHEVLTSKRGRITSDPAIIQKWMEEFTETAFLPRLARRPIRKLIPGIYKLLNIKSTMLLPLTWEGKTIGLLDISGPKIFAPNDLKRVENIVGQLSATIHRNQMEELLKEERNLLRTLIDNLPDRIYVMDAVGRKTLSNTADWKASGGKSMEDVIGKTDFDMYPPELAEPHWQLDRQVMAGKPIINFEEPGLDSEGNPVLVLTTKIPLRNEEGSVIGLVGVGRDITERKRSETERQTLFEIMQGLAVTNDVQEFLKLTHDAIAKVIFAENFFVVLHHADTGLFEEIYTVDQYDPPASPSSLEHSITSYVFRSGEALLLTPKRFAALVEQGEIELVGTDSASWLGVPLKTPSGTIGVIAVQDYENASRYSEQDKDFLASIASQIALAIERKQGDIVLKQRNEDLALLNTVNEAVVKGQDLDAVIQLLSEELKRIFSSVGSTIYMLSPDKQTITMQQYSFAPETANKVEKLLGFAIPKIEFPVKEGGYFHKAMISKRSAITTEPQEIQSWLSEFVETRSLPPMTRGIVRKLIPQIYKVLNIRSTILVPLVSEEETIGFLDISSSSQFTANDLKRIEHIGGHLTAVIQRQRAETAEREQRILAEALRDTAQILNSSLSYEDVLDFILATVERVVAHDAATIMLIDDGVAHVVRSHGYQEQGFELIIKQITLPVAETTNLRQIVESGQPVIVSDTQADPGWKHDAGTAWIRSNVGVPISIAGNVIGFILLDSRSTRFFTPMHAERLQAFATQAALAIQNARLLQRAQNEIAERKQAEAALRESEQRYRTIFENSPVSIWEEDFSYAKDSMDALKQQGITDFRAYFASNPEVVENLARNIRVLDVNNAGLQMYKAASKRELVDSTNREISEGEREHNLEDFIAIAEGKTANSWEGRDLTMTNEPLEINLKWSVAPGHEHDFSKVYVTVLDITERKRAEHELRDSEERFRQMATNIEEGFWITAVPSGDEVYISPAAAKIWGNSVEYFMTTPDAVINSVWQEDRPRVLDALEKQKHGKKTELEYRILYADGSVRWVWDRAFPILDETGNVIRMAGIAADVTERKQAEQALRESENKAKALINALPDLMFRLDREGTFLDYKAEKSELYAQDEPSLINKKIHEVSPIEFANLVQQHTWQALNSGEMQVFEFQLLIPGRGTREFEARMVVSGKDEVTAVVRDITERKQTESALLQSQARYHDLFDKSPSSLWEEDYSLVKSRIDDLQRSGVANLSEYFGDHPEVVIELASLVRIVDVNKASVELYHAEQKEDLLKNLTQILDRELLLHFQDEVLGLMSPARRFVWEGPDKTFDGTPLELIVTGTIPSGYEEDWSKVIVSIIDITERKQAEDALRASDERFTNAFEFAPIGKALVALDGHFLKVNSAMSNILGYTNPELTTKSFQELTHPEDLESGLNHLPQMLAGEINAYQMEKRYLHKTGKVVWGLLNVSLVRDRQGQPEYFIAQIQDITENKRTEEEMHRRGQETAALLETSLALTNLDLRVILQSLGQSAQDLFNAEGCRIFLLQPDGETLRCVLALQDEVEAFGNLRLKLGEGVTGAVALSGKAEIVNEMQDDPRAVQVPNTEEYEKEAVMFAPLKEREQTIGVLSIRRAGNQNPFQPSDLELLEAFASMAASAVSNARLYEEAQRRLSEAQALYENGLAVGRLLEPRDIGYQIIETFARYLSWHHVAIRLLNPETKQLQLIAFNQPGLSDEDRAAMELRFNSLVSKPDQGLSGLAMQTGQAIRTGDVHTQPQYVDTHEGIMSGLYMPLKVADRVIGCISVESDRPDAFGEQDERLLATLANQAAIAFENAYLYQAAQQEIRERKRAQDALWTSETHYRQLADSITDILFEMDYDLLCTHWNKASEMFSGIPAQDAIGRTLHDMFGNAQDTLLREQIYRSVLHDRQAKMFETQVVVRGQKRFLEINAYPSAQGVSVVAKDVTERKLAETLMEKRFELMEFSAHHSLDKVMQRTIDELSSLTESHIGFIHFVEADQKTIKLQTWSSETLQFLGKPQIESMQYPLDAAGVWADAVRLRRPIIHNDYGSLPNKNGLPENQLPVMREMAIPIIRNEKITAVLGIGNKAQDYTHHDLEIVERFADYAWDIAERKQMEMALAEERNQLARRVEERTADLSRANSNLARALHVKDEFLANMSHELRTPLNAILGLSESLGEQVAGPLNEKQQKYLSTINESGHHLLSLINDILDLAKIEAGQITLDINKVDVNSVCQASLRMIKQLAQRKNQQVQFEMDSDLGLMWADERRLKQMIVNLLSNAVKFTPEEGSLGLEVRGDRSGNKVSISVWDQGIGISESGMQRLFKPFVQLDAGLAREATGTGLGLALVAQMARLHGGSVTVESQVGQGSRFTILLPWEPALAGENNSRLRSTGKFRAIRPDEIRPTILLIEDTSEVVMMLVDYLEMAGFNMVTAQDGIDGLTQAKLFHPNLILMDIQMPRMDGFETTKRLRNDPEFKDTPIIALTALAMPNDRERCLDAGMNEYLSKPVNLKALTKTIKTFLYDPETNQV